MNQQLSGLPAWLVQRLSAVYMVLYSIMVLAYWMIDPPLDYPAWRGLFAHPVVLITTAMFLLALLLHVWVGVRDVILDYAGRFPSVRLLLLTLLGGWLIAMGLWGLRIVLRGMLL